uniref:Uncharacterized protein n=1 Tax=Meloidogyne incognita TaxID=6306 RepID=A0A914M145_MELIC
MGIALLNLMANASWEFNDFMNYLLVDFALFRIALLNLMANASWEFNDFMNYLLVDFALFRVGLFIRFS